MANKSATEKIQSLRHRSDFLRIQRYGLFYRSRSLTMMVSHRSAVNADLSKPIISPEICAKQIFEPSLLDGRCRVGYTVSRKIGNAVLRNRLRRRLKAALYVLRAHLLEYADYVIIPFPHAQALGHHALLEELKCLLTKTIHGAKRSP